MTKIGFCSDIHLEFGPITLLNKDNIDLLILAGDICTPHLWGKNHNNSMRRIKDEQLAFFRSVSDQFPYTLYIPGNHEHYHGDVTKTDEIIAAEMPVNISTSNYLTAQFDGFGIVATTLWTDFNGGNPYDFMSANMGMNDFRLVKLDGTRFRAEDAFLYHQKALNKMDEDLPKIQGKKIVVTHHLPSYQAIAPGFRDSRLNSAYASNLDAFMEKHEIDYWIHGHSHTPLDMMVGNTRLLRNPRGYVGHEHSKEEDKKYSYNIIEV